MASIRKQMPTLVYYPYTHQNKHDAQAVYDPLRFEIVRMKFCSCGSTRESDRNDDFDETLSLNA